ncbi:MAG: hypothetical protein ABSC72_06360 [Methylovirgula sp.]|jgi:hypothetical protein
MPEQAPANPPIEEHFDNPITIIEAEARFRAAGLPRHPKSIERYCRIGSLRCKKEFGANGFQYLIEPASADELIEFLKQAHHIRNIPEQAPASASVLRENERVISEEQRSRALPSAPARSAMPIEENHEEHAGTGSDTLRYVQQLEKRLDEKDGEIAFLRIEVAVKNDQIKDLTERARETNHLIAGLQKMLTPLLGRSPESRVDAAVHSERADDFANEHAQPSTE